MRCNRLQLNQHLPDFRGLQDGLEAQQDNVTDNG